LTVIVVFVMRFWSPMIEPATQEFLNDVVLGAADAGAAPNVPASNAAPPTRAAARLVVSLMEVLRSVHREIDFSMYGTDH
jgi:hypothetical protein